MGINIGVGYNKDGICTNVLGGPVGAKH